MIEIKNLCKKYSDLIVFEDFSLSIEKGKITCILGESGSGKTTLLNVLANLTDFDGEVDRIDVSYVFQKHNLFPNMTVEKNLLAVNKNKEEVEKILLDFEMLDKKTAYSKHLSGGQSQRVSLMRGLLFDAPLLLLDEPFSSLDLKLKFNLMELLKDYHQKKNNTVLMVTHDIKEAVTLAERIVVLKKGKIIKDVTCVDEQTEEELYKLLING